MASLQSSHATSRSLAHVPPLLEGAGAHCYSENRCLGVRRNTNCDIGQCNGNLEVGDTVEIYSRSANAYFDGKVTEFVESNYAQVEYEVSGRRCSKTLHVQHLVVPSISDSDEEHDPSMHLTALEALVRCTPDSPKRVNELVHGEVAGYGDAAGPEAFMLSPADQQLRKTTMIIASNPDKGLEVWMQCLGEADPDVRRTAMAEVEKSVRESFSRWRPWTREDTAVLEYLQWCLHDSDLFIRRAAANAIDSMPCFEDTDSEREV